MSLGRGVAPLFASRAGRFDALHVADILPPAGVPLVGWEVLRINIRFPVRHCARGPEHKGKRTRQRVIEEKSGGVSFEIGRKEAA